MGLSLSMIKNWYFGAQSVRLLMVGLDGAGKTTMLYKLKLGELIHTIPTIGFNVETVTYRNISFTMWDVGGQQKIRTLWHYYFQNTQSPFDWLYFDNCYTACCFHGDNDHAHIQFQAVIFVVDSTDKHRFDEAREELEALLKEDQLRDAKVLVFNNKSDMAQAVSSADVAVQLGLTNVKGREWCVMTCSAKTGEGIYEGLEKLHSSVTGKKAMDGEIY